MHLLAINQSTSTLFRDVVDHFGQFGLDVKLLTGYLERGKGYRPKFRHIPGCKFKRAPIWSRLRTWGRFAIQAFRAMVKHRDHFALLVSNPPLVPWIAPIARRLFGVRYGVLVYDVYPDIMVRMGMISGGGLIERFLRRLSAASLRNADCVITLGTRMRQTLLGHLPPGEAVDIHVIPNWADIDFIKPLSRQDNPFAREHGLVDKFVVMYSGAFGATHDIEGIIDAAEALRDLDDVRVVLIGGGTRQKQVRAYAQEKALPNLLLLPWQPVESIPYSLAAADCQIISLDAAYSGISVPSKSYSALAAGVAILAVSASDCELADLVRDYRCGICVRPRDNEALARAVRKLHADRKLLRQMKTSARQAAENCFNRQRCTAQYAQVLLPAIERCASNQRSTQAKVHSLRQDQL